MSLRNRVDLPTATAFGCIILLLIGSPYSKNFLSPAYLLQQLKAVSLRGVIATGMMLVILLGHIDLSAPRVVTTGAMMASAATAYGPMGEALAIPFGAPCGMSVGFVSGLGAPYQPFPAMIATLAMNAIAQGLMVACTGGLSPADGASGAMRYIATGTLIGDMPNAILVWALIRGMAALILTRTGFGRSVHAIVNREGAAYLPGAPAQRILVIAFAISGGLSALGGVLLAGYAGKTAQSMGDAYLPPAIAAVVRGGTSILGERGKHLGIVASVILITLLQSILSVMQTVEFGRQIIYRGVILAMLLPSARKPRGG